jgi:phosphate-selective porin OprO/OprP
MTISTQAARYALLAALGVAMTGFSSVGNSVDAEDTGFKFHNDSYAEQIALMPSFMQGSDDKTSGDSSSEQNAADEESSDSEESEVESLTSKLEELEEKFAEMEESIDEVVDEVGDPTIVRSGTSKSTMKISGRVHLDAWGFDHDENINPLAENDTDEANRLGFRRLRFGVKGKIKDNMVYKIEMEFANGNDAEFRDAYLGWSNLPVLQKVLAGNQKRPYGLDHLNSSRYNVFIERPFVIEAFNEDARRLGLQSYGVSDDQAWNWRYGVFNSRNVQDEGNYVGDHLQLEIASRLANTIWYDDISGGRGYAHWAIAGAHSDVSTNQDPDEGAVAESRFRTRPEARTAGTRWLDTGLIDGADYYNLLALEAVVNVGAFQVVGEYQHNWVERDGFEDVQLNGGYVYASYFLTGEHIPWDRSSGTIGRVKPFQNFWLVNKCDGCTESGWGAWQLAARYSVADFSDEDVAGGEAEALTIGLNWHWNENSRMQFNYITGNIEDRTDLVGTGNYDIFGARFMVDF